MKTPFEIMLHQFEIESDMETSLNEYRKETLLSELEEEISAIRSMPEKDVCLLYNVDTREEAIMFLRENY